MAENESTIAYIDKESCRVCMTRSKINMKNIFEETNNNIIEKIQFCTGISLENEDGFPTCICKLCLRSLTIAYKFKTKCIHSDETFRKILMVKAEIQSDTEDYVNNDNLNDTKDNNESCNDVKAEIKDVLLIENAVKEEFEKLNEEHSVKLSDIRIRKLVSHTHRNRFKRNGVPSRFKKFKYKKLFCESCNMKFETKQESDEHKKQVHKESEPWVCEICGKSFVHRASLYTHVRSHLPPQNKCDYCEYRTCNKHDLVKHIRIHTGDKRYKCDQCACAYHSVSNLREHKRRHHERLKRFKCPRPCCDKEFFDRTKLNRHLDSHDDVKRYPCEICHSRFTRRCYWKKHMLRQHSIEVPPQRPGRQKEIFLVAGNPDHSDEDETLKTNKNLLYFVVLFLNMEYRLKVEM